MGDVALSRTAADLHATLTRRILQGTTTCRDVGLLDELLGVMRRRYLVRGLFGGGAAIALLAIVAFAFKSAGPIWVLAAAYAAGVLWLSIPKVD